NRIWVSGNVKIVLTQGEKESVIGAENYDATKTSVSSNGKTLYINSMETSQVTLNITVKDLERIEAYGQSVVITNNNFDVKNLQLFLNQSATARIKTTATSLYTVVKEDAVLKLNGTAAESTMVASNAKNVKLGDFVSLKSVSYASETIMDAEKTAMTLAK
ncbi:GIN domain-containing protein, partial [Pedobacter sp. CFBP9032]|uniref:GIN domain-containing protein n=1 Tax=Pedobacter sp. CFBP9032 TaxID=3096539 RepID=UPI002A6B4816